MIASGTIQLLARRSRVFLGSSSPSTSAMRSAILATGLIAIATGWKAMGPTAVRCASLPTCVRRRASRPPSQHAEG